MSMDLIQISNDLVISAADLGASQTSSVVELKNGRGFAAQISWSGGSSTAGDIIVEGTNDDPNQSPTYTQISTDAVSTTSGSLMKNNSNAMYAYVRIRWARSAGTGGTISCKVSVKR